MEDVTLPPISHGCVLPLQWRRKREEKMPRVAQDKSVSLRWSENQTQFTALCKASPCAYVVRLCYTRLYG